VAESGQRVGAGGALSNEIISWLQVMCQSTKMHSIYHGMVLLGAEQVSNINNPCVDAIAIHLHRSPLQLALQGVHVAAPRRRHAAE
jgi:hypothetical protein